MIHTKIQLSFNDLYRRYSALLIGVLVFFISVNILFIGENTGLSNNGDFQRVMESSSIKIINPDRDFLYENHYEINLPSQSLAKNITGILFDTETFKEYPSTHLIFSRISVVINLFVNKITNQPLNTYNLNILGFMYALMYSATVAFFLSQFKFKKIFADILFKVISIIILCDIGYTAYFNSLFGEAPQHISLIFSAAMTMRICSGKIRLRHALLCFIGAIIYGGSKFFNIPVALIILLVDMGIIAVHHKRIITACTFSILGIAVLFTTYLNTPKWMDIATNYNAVFYGAVNDTTQEKAEEYLESIGLPAEMASYRGTNYYVAGVHDRLSQDGFRETIKDISKFDLLRFYITHPLRLFELMPTIAKHSDMIRPYYISNFPLPHGRMELSREFSLWSSLRSVLPFDTVLGNLLIISLFFILLIQRYYKSYNKKLWILFISGVFVSLSYTFLASLMFNGMGDLAKHQFAFSELMDIVFIAVIALFIETLLRDKSSIIFKALCICLGVFIISTPLSDNIWNIYLENKPHKSIEEGSYISFGNINGKAITWLVTKAEDEYITLISSHDITQLPYSEQNLNAWEISSVRQWLNSDFLNGFSKEEQAILVHSDNKVLCTRNNYFSAEDGDMEILCNHIADDCDANYHNAYSYTTKDTVTLPDLDTIAQLSRNHYDISGDYWLQTVYAFKNYMTRYVNPEGYVFFTESRVEKGIRPMITINSQTPISGKGTRNNPFILQLIAD